MTKIVIYKEEFKMYVNVEQHIYKIYKEAEYCKYNMICANTFDDELFYKDSLGKKLLEIGNLLEGNCGFGINKSLRKIK